MLYLYFELCIAFFFRVNVHKLHRKCHSKNLSAPFFLVFLQIFFLLCERKREGRRRCDVDFPHHGPPTYSPQAFIGKCMLFKHITDTYIKDNRLSSLSLTNWVTQNSWTDFCLVFTHTSPMAGQNHHVVCHPSLHQLCMLDLKAVIHLFLIRRLTIQTALSHVLNFLWYSIQIVYTDLFQNHHVK